MTLKSPKFGECSGGSESRNSFHRRGEWKWRECVYVIDSVLQTSDLTLSTSAKVQNDRSRGACLEGAVLLLVVDDVGRVKNWKIVTGAARVVDSKYFQGRA